MVSIHEAIVVEGRYDKNTISQIVDAPIFQTDGFGIMRNKEQLALLRAVAEKRGLIVFTDSDGAGFVIRNYIKSSIPGEFLKHAYIPDVMGKERRKEKPGKEGLLGVEGMDPEVILEALRRAGATFGCVTNAATPQQITKVDFAELGLSGGFDSKRYRESLLRYLNLPQHMSANALLEALNVLYTREDLVCMMDRLFNTGSKDD